MSIAEKTPRAHRRSILPHLIGPLLATALSVGPMAASAAPRSGSKPTTVTAPAGSPKTSFNRSVQGGASGLGPGILQRAYKVNDGLGSPGGARSMGLRSHGYANDGRNGTARLPVTNAAGQAVSYRTTYLRPGGHARKYGNARMVTGTDGSAYLTRHYGSFKRIQ